MKDEFVEIENKQVTPPTKTPQAKKKDRQRKSYTLQKKLECLGKLGEHFLNSLKFNFLNSSYL